MTIDPNTLKLKVGDTVDTTDAGQMIIVKITRARIYMKYKFVNTTYKYDVYQNRKAPFNTVYTTGAIITSMKSSN